jgi:hypothetical protein
MTLVPPQPIPISTGSGLGTFSVGDTLQIGGQQKSWKSDGTNVTGHGISCRVYSGTPSGSFTTVNLPFQWNTGDSGAPAGLNNFGDQQWGGDIQGANNSLVLSTNVLAGLTPGSYTLDVYSFITTENPTSPIFNNVGGNNYKATFTVIPEPASAALGLVGGLLLLRRRRI